VRSYDAQLVQALSTRGLSGRQIAVYLANNTLLSNLYRKHFVGCMTELDWRDDTVTMNRITRISFPATTGAELAKKTIDVFNSECENVFPAWDGTLIISTSSDFKTVVFKVSWDTLAVSRCSLIDSMCSFQMLLFVLVVMISVAILIYF
jgi:hypothetical protein